MATAAKVLRQVLLDNVDWRTYTRLLRIFSMRRSVRLTYDRGRLEIMSPLREHECSSELLSRLVVALTEELGLPLCSGGSTTYRRKSLKRGLEPDQSVWIANEPRVRTKRKINLKVDPPPDLAIEVDLTSSSLDRLGIYAALKVPEVWRLEGNHLLTFHLLGPDEEYAEGASRSFPGLKPEDLLAFLTLQFQIDQNAIVRQFRDWVRQRIADAWK